MRRHGGGRPHSGRRGAVLSHRPFPGRHPRALRRSGARGGQPGSCGAADGRGERSPSRGRLRHGGPGGVAATVGPGLIGALLVGVQTAKAIAWSTRLPLYPVNHLHGHLAAVWLGDPEAPFPMVTLVASGGHTFWSGSMTARRSDFSVRPSTTPRARPSTRAPDSWGWAIPAERSSTRWPRRGILGPSLPDRPQALAPARLLVLGREDRALLPSAGDGGGGEVRRMRRHRRLVSRSHSERVGDQDPPRRGRERARDGGGGRRRGGQLAPAPAPGEEGGARACTWSCRRLAYCTDNAAMIGAAALSGPALRLPDYLDVDASASLLLGQWLPGPRAFPGPLRIDGSHARGGSAFRAAAPWRTSSRRLTIP